MQRSSPSRRSRALVIAIGALIGVSIGASAAAHDEIAGSTPEHQEQFDEPISEVVIDFGQPVDGVELALVAPDDSELPGEVVIISETEAKLVFAELEEKGEYLVRFLAEEDGHLVGGAISFVYGSPDSGGASALTWVFFGLLAALVLAIGAFFSLRHSVAQHDEDDELLDATSS